MSSNIWTQCGAASNFRRLAANPWRVVEAQHLVSTLKLVDIGPAPQLELTLAPRLNVLTGDNGLGKSFLLDLAWWALTAT